jgi:hypothetical protein
MNIAALIAEIEAFGVRFELDAHHGVYEVAVWFDTWEVREATEELVDLLRPAWRKRQVIAILLARGLPPAELSTLPVAIGDGRCDRPATEEPVEPDDFTGLLQLQERELQCLLGSETIISTEGLSDEDVIRDAGEAP